MKTVSMGLTKQNKRMNYSIAFVAENKECGVILVDKKSGEECGRISLSEAPRYGNVVVGDLEGVDFSAMGYVLYDGEKVFSDPYANLFLKLGQYGEKNAFPKVSVYDNQAVMPVKVLDERIPCEELIVYEAHVRGFTMHPSSKVRGKGTFYGMTQKIPYLKSLGINAVSLQPIYEFEEVSEEGKLNYWGYTKGYYFAPKAFYSYSQNAQAECAQMINAFHENGMEVILQFYFPNDVSYDDMLSALRYWVYVYGVDGFHLIGENIPLEALSKDAMLSQVRLWYHDASGMHVPCVYGKEVNKRFGLYREDYLYEMRRFLKGDENLVGDVMRRMRTNPSSFYNLNFFAHYAGFTLADTVSYERKNNEANGEGGQDGASYNASWNCGAEGDTNKRSVRQLRKKQMKNAFALLLTSSGVPVIFMGDEFANSQKGNNNPYGIDSEVTWLNWSEAGKNKELTSFVSNLIELRKSAKVFMQKKECMLMDYASCGYPDLSYHGKEAWKPQTESFSREFAFLYCGDYVQDKGTLYYVAVNMHHEEHEFALPKLPKNTTVRLLMTTDDAVCMQEKEITLPPRSVAIYFINTEKRRKL